MRHLSTEERFERQYRWTKRAVIAGFVLGVIPLAFVAATNI